ncbi:MAG: Rdx family protein [Dehalococcoidia bacterium]
MAAWMATEIWHDFGAEAPVTLVPSDKGRLELYANGKTLFDRKAEGGKYPDMSRVREIKKQIADMLGD